MLGRSLREAGGAGADKVNDNQQGHNDNENDDVEAEAVVDER